jgi:hypothetical protein
MQLKQVSTSCFAAEKACSPGWGPIAPHKPGSARGFGTIPDCAGCDHDDFIDLGVDIQITFERLGTLRCRFAEAAGKLLPSRWPVRGPLKQYHGLKPPRPLTRDIKMKITDR